MKDNIFEVETTVLAHLACETRNSIFFIDIVCAYPRVNLSWIIHDIDKAEVPRYACRFLRSIYFNGTAEVEFA